MKRLRHALSCFLLLAFAAQARPDATEEWLDRMREAVGYVPSRQAIEIRGRTEYLGLRGLSRLVLAADGRFVQSATTREPGFLLEEIVVYDGREVRRRDFTGLVRPLELRDRDEQLALAWMTGYRHLEPNGPFVLELDPESSTPELAVFDVRLRDRPWTARLFVDATTALPSRLEYESGSGITTVRFVSYDEEPVRRPRETTIEIGGIVYRSAFEPARNRRVSDEDFALELQRPTDFRFDPDAPPAVESKVLPIGLVLVKATVDDREEGWFLLDSGAGTYALDRKFLEETLRLRGFGKIPVFGAGGASASRLFRAQSLRIGPLTIERPIVVGLEGGLLDQLGAAFRIPIRGILGYDVFARAVVVMDKQEGIVELHPPGREPPGTVNWQPVRLYANHPCITARFEGDREGVFMLDTGAAIGLIFSDWAVEEYRLREGRTTSPTALGGVGGFQAADAGRVAWIEFAGRRFEDVPAVFARPGRGIFSDRYRTGILGNPLTRVFRLVFDYPNSRIAFVPRDRTSSGADGGRSASVGMIRR